jgi:hypothetical protein
MVAVKDSSLIGKMATHCPVTTFKARCLQTGNREKYQHKINSAAASNKTK